MDDDDDDGDDDGKLHTLVHDKVVRGKSGRRAWRPADFEYKKCLAFQCVLILLYLMVLCR